MFHIQNIAFKLSIFTHTNKLVLRSQEAVIKILISNDYEVVWAQKKITFILHLNAVTIFTTEWHERILLHKKENRIILVDKDRVDSLRCLHLFEISLFQTATWLLYNSNVLHLHYFVICVPPKTRETHTVSYDPAEGNMSLWPWPYTQNTFDPFSFWYIKY